MRGIDICFTKWRCQTYDLCGVLTCEGTLHCNLYLMPIHAVIAESAKVAVAQVDIFPANGEDLAW